MKYEDKIKSKLYGAYMLGCDALEQHHLDSCGVLALECEDVIIRVIVERVD